eukprot:4333279-Prymnesium_polylepis.1
MSQWSHFQPGPLEVAPGGGAALSGSLFAVLQLWGGGNTSCDSPLTAHVKKRNAGVLRRIRTS